MPAPSCSPSVHSSSTPRPSLLPPKGMPLSFHTFHDLYTNKMSITQTFHLAHRARGKLSSEAARSDHNLRILVGHANLLDSLTLHLAEAEAEQERWFNNTVRGNAKRFNTDCGHIVDSRVKEAVNEEEEEEEEYGSLATDYESDTESESDDDDGIEFEMVGVNFFREHEMRFPHPTRPEPLVSVSKLEFDDNQENEDELEEEQEEEETSEVDDDDGMFMLTRTKSHRPPSLCSDVSDDDEEESQPPSPPQLPVYQPPPFSRKEQQRQLEGSAYFEPHHSHEVDDEDPSSELHTDQSHILFHDRLIPAMISSF